MLLERKIEYSYCGYSSKFNGSVILEGPHGDVSLQVICIILDLT